MTTLVHGSIAANPGTLAKQEAGDDAPASLGMMPRSFNDVARMASALAKARGFVPAAYVGNPAAIAAAIMTGLEIGIGPMQALREIHVIEGRPTLSATMMLALAIRAGVRHQWVRADDEVAHVRLTRPGFEPHEQTYTMADAKRAGLAGRGNWGKHPGAMLRARCVSSAMRAFCPDVLGGSVYVEGEIEPGPPAQTVAPDDDVIDAPDIDAQSPAAEAACGAQEPDGDEPARPDEPPAQLTDCRTAEELGAWVFARRRGLMGSERGRQMHARIIEHGEAIGVPESEVRAWLSPDRTEAA